MRTNLLRASAIALALGIAGATSAMAQGSAPGGEGAMMGWLGEGSWGWWGPHVLGGLLFWIVLIVAGVLLAGALRRPRGEPSALEILERRYARGEIGREEYELKRRDLQT